MPGDQNSFTQLCLLFFNMSLLFYGPSSSLSGLLQNLLEEQSSLVLWASPPSHNAMWSHSDARWLLWYHPNTFADLDGLADLAQTNYLVSHVSHYLCSFPDPSPSNSMKKINMMMKYLRTMQWGGQDSFTVNDQRKASLRKSHCMRTYWSWMCGKVGRNIERPKYEDLVGRQSWAFVI